MELAGDARTSRPPAATHELQPVYPGSLWSFNPTNSYSHTIKRSRKPPILQVLTKLFNPYYLLFLPANSGLSRIPGLPASVNRKLNGGKQPFVREALTGSRPGDQTTSPNKIPENWYSSREFGSLSCAPGARPLVHRLSTTTVDNLSGVWEF